MAKMFYTMDETKAALGKNEDDIKQLARDGKLREFRDGPRLMFKADQVELLKADLGGGGTDQVTLGAGDTHTPLGLMDSKTGSGSGAAMKVETATGTPAPKEDTASGMDVGLSGSLSGSIGGGSLAGGSLGGTGGVGSGTANRGTGKPGVNVLADEGHEVVDPMAQTHITPQKDQISLEGVGSGSGLLDLTRETDDTSLGAALLDEISPGGKRVSPTPAGITPSSSGSTAGIAAIPAEELPETAAPSFVGAPVTVEAPDAVAPAFSGAAIAAAIMVILAGFVMINALVGENPMVPGAGQIPMLAKDNAAYMFLGIGGVLAIVLFIVGIITGRRSGATA